MNLSQKKIVLRPPYFIFQWHITERCNWRCRHCYQDAAGKKRQLPLDRLVFIFKQYLHLIKHLGLCGPRATRISITGGEPLLHPDFFSLLEAMARLNNGRFFLSLLSNGSLINLPVARRRKKLGGEAVQVSIEGEKKQNDRIRGEGAFEKTKRALGGLAEAGIAPCVSLTLTKGNISSIPAVIKFCERNAVKRLGVRRLVPIGTGKDLERTMPSPQQVKESYRYIETMAGLYKQRGLEIVRGCEEGIFSREAGRPIGACAAVEGRCLVVLANGDVVPCRRLPLKLGSVLDDSLTDVYYNAEALMQLRNLNNAHPSCQACPSFDACLAGARWVSAAYFNNPFAPDPQCPRLFKALPERRRFEGWRMQPAIRQRICSRLFGGYDEA